MNVISSHEFLEKEGELALLLNVVSFEEASEPVLLISKNENTAYLRRSPDDIHEIIGINASVIEAVRKANVIAVVEMMGDNVTRSYNAPTALFDENQD